jgi:imidazolonepropionase-like amidohydrolase
MSLLISDAALIDGVAEKPLEGCSVWIEGRRIKGIGRRDDFPRRPQAEVIDAHGKYLIPGLMNANVHLLCDIRIENLARYTGRYEDLIAEAAQVSLKNGLTTVFDTWGPRRFLAAVRDRIEAGSIPGSRIFCAGNIVGFDGPFSPDFIGKASELASPAFLNRINAIWVENVGRQLMWQTPDQVGKELRTYLARGVDFVKYASNEHHGTSAGAFLAFSPKVQRTIIDEAHRAGRTAQAHTTSVEGLRIAVEEGCDLIQHANLTGPVAIPQTTLELIVSRGTGAVIFPMTHQAFEWTMKNARESLRTMMLASDNNTHALIRSGAKLMLANDGAILAREAYGDRNFATIMGSAPEEENLYSLPMGHFFWLRAMEEKGCKPMDLLRAATCNIAAAYGKADDLGTLEAGKIADILVLNQNPLEAARNYRSIHRIIKDGAVVDRESLPVTPLLTRPLDAPAEEEAVYVPFFSKSIAAPLCPTCMWHTGSH